MSCAAALASWDIIEEEGLLAHVREVGPYFQQQLRTLGDIPLVADVRGAGLMAAIEMRLGNDVEGDDLLAQDYALGELVDLFAGVDSKHKDGVVYSELSAWLIVW